MNRLRASIVGGSGYVGGELIRLLLFHPGVEIQQVTSEKNRDKFVHRCHPNLRGMTKLKFSSRSELTPCDVLFLALPHGETMNALAEFECKAARIIDLSADFRLNDPALFQTYYGASHTCPERLSEFIYGIPELHRHRMVQADKISSAGCNATAVILALAPLFREALVELDRTVVEVKAGSSQGGNQPSEGSHHPERAGCFRTYKPTGHRHCAEMVQELGFGHEIAIHFTATSVDSVRGIHATCHTFLKEDLSEKEIWKVYRKWYGEEPFIRIVKEKDGIYRQPEPKLLAGTNFCDIGFERDPHSNRLVVISAIDNLMKGAAGQAVQAFNLMYGLDEKTGLMFPGLHPV